MKKPVIMVDYAGVYFTYGAQIASKILSRKFGIPQKNILRLLSTGPYVRKYFEGKITRKEFWKNASKFFNVPEKQAGEIENLWHSSYKPNKGMPQLVKRLRKKYRVVALSGNTKERVRFLNKKYKIYKEFHEVHYSFHYGVDKPDVRLFKNVARKMKIKPEDCIVVDDFRDFLSEVRKTGARTILFRNAAQLEQQLRKMGVEV